jgi:hypothetical protein
VRACSFRTLTSCFWGQAEVPPEPLNLRRQVHCILHDDDGVTGMTQVHPCGAQRHRDDQDLEGRLVVIESLDGFLSLVSWLCFVKMLQAAPDVKLFAAFLISFLYL